MPKNTRVHRCVEKLKGKKGINAYAVCQASTGQNFATGKKLKNETYLDRIATLDEACPSEADFLNGYDDDDVRISEITLQTDEEERDNGYSSRQYTTGIVGYVAFELERNVRNYILYRRSQGEELPEIVDDMGLYAQATRAARQEIGQHIRVISWTPTLLGSRLILQPIDFE
jgi:hypothetical protein